MTWLKYSAFVARHAGNVENQTMFFHLNKEQGITIGFIFNAPFGLNKKHDNNATKPFFRFHFFSLQISLPCSLMSVCLSICRYLSPCINCLFLKGNNKFYALHIMVYFFPFFARMNALSLFLFET